jgi:hypothetical protein
LPTSKGPPSSLVQLRIAVWTGDTRDTRPKAVIAGTEIPQRSSVPCGAAMCYCHLKGKEGAGVNKKEIRHALET